MCRDAPTGAIDLSFGVDVITHAKLYVNRFRGFGILMPPILSFSTGLSGCPYKCHLLTYLLTYLNLPTYLIVNVGTWWKWKVRASRQHGQNTQTWTYSEVNLGHRRRRCPHVSRRVRVILSVPGLTGTRRNYRRAGAGITVRGPPETAGTNGMEWITMSSPETPTAPVHELN